MIVEHTVHTLPTDGRPDDWYLPDPPKKLKMDQFFCFLLPSVPNTIYRHFAHLPDFFIGAEGYLCFDPRRLDGRLVPDLMIAFGVDRHAIRARRGYVISDVGKPPDFVLEVASKWTARADYTYKMDRYAEFEVPEYWLFDYTGGLYHGAPLAGYLLAHGEYEPIRMTTEPDGMVWGRSPALGLDLCWDQGVLRLYDPVAREYLRNPDELEDELNAERDARIAAEARIRQLKEVLRQMSAE